MLIYNYKKEFLGIDEADLEAFGLATLADLRAESADFADLFVKTPGCIHNFKHVHWIDYVLDKDGAEAKVIIHIKNKNYSAGLTINTVYLVDNPAKKAFGVVLTNVKALSASQSEKLLTDIAQRPAPQPASGPTEIKTIPSSVVYEGTQEEIEAEMAEVAYDPYEADTTPATVMDIYEADANKEIEVEDLTAEDAPVDLELEEMSHKEEVTTHDEVVEDVYEEEPKYVAPEVVAKKEEKKPEYVEEGEFANYVYDPEVASEELGLPIDLIEEFIQDFITQAHSFKEELYKSTQEQEIDNVKIQSHKLKGVAANLRIEDALDAITLVNTSDDYDVIKTNLDRFYLMIDKLSGKTPVVEAEDNFAEDVSVQEDDDDDELILSFKDDDTNEQAKELSISDDDVPDSISVAELADDDFLANDVVVEDKLEENLDILDSDEQNTQDTAQEDTKDTSTTYDKQQVANDIGLDLESFNELFEDYLKESKEIVETINNSAQNDDLTICKNLTNKLKGMSENMRVESLNADLDNILASSDVEAVKASVQNLLSKLSHLSTQG
jgi:HPt (histidine-containing phosphotransfer) domain-containing protein